MFVAERAIVSFIFPNRHELQWRYALYFSHGLSAIIIATQVASTQYVHLPRSQDLTDWNVSPVEVRLKLESTARFDTISKFVHQTLEQDEQIYLPSSIGGWDSHPVLSQNVELIRATESSK